LQELFIQKRVMGKESCWGWSRPGRWFLSHNPQRLVGAVISIDCGKRERNRGLGAFGPLGQSVEHGGPLGQWSVADTV
jgi:hypothetical protein